MLFRYDTVWIHVGRALLKYTMKDTVEKTLYGYTLTGRC